MRRRVDKAALLTIASSASVAFMAIWSVVLDNPGEIAPADISRAVLVFIPFATVVPLILLASPGPLRLAGLAFPLILFAFFKFTGFLGAAEFAGLGKEGSVAAALIGFALVSVAAADCFRRRDPQKLAFGVFIVASAMAVGSGGVAALALFQGNSRGETIAAEIADAPAVRLDRTDLPDIIYIVPDRYGSKETLAREFGHDNSAFLAALEALGFYVAPNPWSNFAKTVGSLASSMNMSDLSSLTAAMDPHSVDRGPLHLLIRDNAVQRILKAAGYRYEHFGNWWEPTRRSPHADAHFYGIDTAWSRMNEFEHALLRLTPVSIFATDGAAAERAECDRLKNQLERLESVRAESDRPVFIFAHLTMPHDPVTMNETGTCIPNVYYPGYGTQWRDYQAAHAGYVSYLNKRLLEIFDANRAIENGRGLVFVIQSDEGPYPKRLQERPDMIMQDFTADEIREKFGIINALYWDTERYGKAHLTETPINNWRIILSAISGEEMPLVEDERSFLMKSDRLVYDLKDVTDVLVPPQRRLQAKANSSVD